MFYFYKWCLKTILSTEKWATGIYFYQVLGDNEILQSGKIVRE